MGPSCGAVVTAPTLYLLEQADSDNRAGIEGGVFLLVRARNEDHARSLADCEAEGPWIVVPAAERWRGEAANYDLREPDVEKHGIHYGCWNAPEWTWAFYGVLPSEYWSVCLSCDAILPEEDFGDEEECPDCLYPRDPIPPEESIGYEGRPRRPDCIDADTSEMDAFDPEEGLDLETLAGPWDVS